MPPVETEDVGAAQSRLFEALLSLLEELGSEHAVVLMIEDLHWADRSTRNFLTFLARSLCRERVLVVGSYRPDELHRRHPLRPLLAELERAGRSRRIELAPLTRAELAEALGDILGAPPDDGLVDRLYVRSEGNPLFAEELLAAGLDGRGALPPTLREALMLRIEALPPTAQELLRLLAAGQRMDHELIEAASGIDPREVREALREAISSHIVTANENGFYGFRHALLREVVHDDLLPGEHAELHRAIALALEERTGARAAAARTAPPRSPTTTWPPATSRPRSPRPFAPPSRRWPSRPTARRATCWTARSSSSTTSRTPRRWPRSTAPSSWRRPRWPATTRATSRARPRCWRRRSSSLDEEAEPRRVAVFYGWLERSLTHWGHADEGEEALAHALSLIPADDRSPERAWLIANRTKALMLRSRFAEAVTAGARGDAARARDRRSATRRQGCSTRSASR